MCLPCSVFLCLRYNTLRISSGLDEVGGIQMHLALCLFAGWIIVFFCVIRGIKTVGKVNQIHTKPFPLSNNKRLRNSRLRVSKYGYGSCLAIVQPYGGLNIYCIMAHFYKSLSISDDTWCSRKVKQYLASVARLYPHSN